MFVLVEVKHEKSFCNTDDIVETKENIVCSNCLELLGNEIWWRYPRMQSNDYINLITTDYCFDVLNKNDEMVDLEIQEIEEILK